MFRWESPGIPLMQLLQELTEMLKTKKKAEIRKMRDAFMCWCVAAEAVQFPYPCLRRGLEQLRVPVPNC